jgi:hypothetical protein
MTTQTLVPVSIKELAAYLFNLLDTLPIEADMGVIEELFGLKMAENDLKFKAYFDLLNEADDKYLITKFDTTEDYFYDAINSKGMYQDKVEYLIKLTINY